MKFKEEIKGTSIVLRKLVEDDAAESFAIRDSTRAKYLNAGPKNIEDQKNWIRSRPSNEINFAITSLENTILGLISLINIDFISLTAEPARFILKNQNLAVNSPVVFEALYMIYEYSFYDLNLRKLHGNIAQSNDRMVKFQLNLGMKTEGKLLSHKMINNQYEDLILVSLFKTDYEEKTRELLKTMINSFQD